ncbi:MAG TPA: CbtA family protein [Bauldia sp.]
MMRTLLIRGMLVGILAGVLAFAFARIFGEPDVDLAIAFEDSMHHAEAAADAPAMAIPADASTPASSMNMTPKPAAEENVELVSRPVQAGIGLFTGVVVYSAAFGGLFALVFGFAYGRAGRFDPRQLAALIAALGFLALVVVPQLKYPANPPSVGQPATIGYRSELFFAMLLVSLVAAVAATYLRGWLARRYDRWNATLIAGAAFVVVVAIAIVLLPGINEVPERFPAVLLWKFRLASLGTEAVLWITLGLVFGALTQRSFAWAR